MLVFTFASYWAVQAHILSPVSDFDHASPSKAFRKFSSNGKEMLVFLKI
jgi:hypothetical protein